MPRQGYGLEVKRDQGRRGKRLGGSPRVRREGKWARGRPVGGEFGDGVRWPRR